VIARFDNEPHLRGEEFADAIMEALSGVRIISCSRVSLSELVFLLQSRGAPDLPDLQDASEYLIVKKWIQKRMEADPDDVPDPETPPQSQVLNTESQNEDATTLPDAGPSEPHKENVNVPRFPMYFVTEERPHRSLRQLSQELETSVTLRPTHIRGNRSSFISSEGRKVGRNSGRVSFTIPRTGSSGQPTTLRPNSTPSRQDFRELPEVGNNINLEEAAPIRRLENSYGNDDFGTLRSKAFVQLSKIYTNDKQF
jgi:hypothetical protein